MQITSKLHPPDILEWWLLIEPCLKTFSEIVELSPVSEVEKARHIAANIRTVYETIQQPICPYEFNEVYNYLTRAVINLYFCYDAIALLQWDESRTFFEVATNSWIHAKFAFHDKGFLGP